MERRGKQDRKEAGGREEGDGQEGKREADFSQMSSTAPLPLYHLRPPSL